MEDIEVKDVRVDFHVHTCYSSDCQMSLERLIKTSIKKGIDCLAITDHNTIEGAKRLKEIAPIKIIIGEEINTTAGEIIGYFLEEEIRSGMSPSETIKAIKEQGGIVCVPHPFDRMRSSAFCRNALIEHIPDIDLIEVFNARNIFTKDNEYALAFARKHDKIVTVGSDCHTQIEVGKCLVQMEDFTYREDFLPKLKQGKLLCSTSSLMVHFVTKYNKLRHRIVKRVFQ